MRPFYTPTSPLDTTLVFESRFESGNLRSAVQVPFRPGPHLGPGSDLEPGDAASVSGPLGHGHAHEQEHAHVQEQEQIHEYDLSIRPDYRTSHHAQWYYFSVRNTRRGAAYKFNLVNLVKSDSLYNRGVRPLMYSVISSSSAAAAAAASAAAGAGASAGAAAAGTSFSDWMGAGLAGPGAAASSGGGWRRGGHSVAYYANAHPRGSSRHKHYYTLSFCVQFDHDFDTVYFAHCYPYTYTQLNRGQTPGHDEVCACSRYAALEVEVRLWLLWRRVG